MRKYPRSLHKKLISASVFAAAAVLALLMVFVCLPGNIFIADAVTPANYDKAVADSDWYNEPEYLDLEALKRVVNMWKSSVLFDFEPIISDPVVVAVIDTGINYEHEIFTGKYDESGVACSEANYDVLLRRADGSILGAGVLQNGSVSENVSDFSDGDTSNKHGTHVAGIVAALIHELDLEKYIKIMPIKASSPPPNVSSFSDSAVRSGIKFALDNGADVVNMSLAGASESYNLVTDENAKNAVFVAAAGNGGGSSKTGRDSMTNPMYPAAGRNVIGVMNYQGTLDGGKALSASSNYGALYDICAPGTAVWSANGATNDGYVTKNGTSMATPIVSFAAALSMLKYRALGVFGEDAIGPKDIAQAIRGSYTDTIEKGAYKFNALNINKLINGGDEMDATIKIGDGESLTMTYGRVKPLHFTFVPLSQTVAENGTVEWYVNDELKGVGQTFEFTPQDVVGQTIVFAIWSCDVVKNGVTSREQWEYRRVITIDYLQVNEQTIKEMNVIAIDDDGNVVEKLTVGKKYTLKLSGLEYVDPSVADGTLWSMGDDVIWHGAICEFTPEETGDVTLSVRVGGRVKNASLKVVKDMYDVDNIILYVTIGIVGAIVIASAILAICIVVKRRAQKRNS